MQINEYLKKYQPIIYKTFANALKNKHLSHAYLLSGNVGTPLKETAIFLAKSLLCDNPSPLACDSCITCLRINDENYPDLMIFDGAKTKIKKGDIEKIIDNFDKTSLENKGIMIYILNLVETMTPVAVNALLKFLEEPGNNIYAFLTTENESKVLPTILSRTQILRFKSIPRSEILIDAKEEDVNNEDAELLSNFYSDGKTIKEISQSETYLNAKNALYVQLEALCSNNFDALYACESKVIPLIKNNETARLYLKLLSIVFQDILNKQVGGETILPSYDNIIDELSTHLKHIDKSLFVIMSSISKIDINVNIPLLLDHIIYEIIKEEKNGK